MRVVQGAEQGCTHLHQIQAVVHVGAACASWLYILSIACPRLKVVHNLEQGSEERCRADDVRAGAGSYRPSS